MRVDRSGGHDPASAHGSISDSAGGTALAYRPSPDYCGPDSFTYWLLPGGAKATVKVTVTCVDDAPVATPDLVTVPFGAFDNALQVLANDVDRDGGPMTVVDVTQPSDGSTSVAPGGAGVIYRPDAGFCNLTAPSPDTFTYTLNGGSTVAVNVRVACPDIAVPTPDKVELAEDSGATTIDVLANDVPKAVTKAIGSTTDPGGGSVQITGQGTTVSYEPEPDFCGTDSFDYTLTPGDLSATVTVTVSCVNDAPVAVDDTRSTKENVQLELPVSGAESLAANDSDADGDPLTVTAASDAVGGTVEVVGGKVSFTPSQDECGAASGRFDYTVSDSHGAVDQGRVTVDVTCAAEAPDLVLADVRLPSTSFGTELRASSNSQGEITYSVVSGDTERVAELSPGGELLVKGPGTFTVQASQAAYAPYAKRQVTATVTIDDGRPGVVITSAPTHVLEPGETFEVRYRVNFVAGEADLEGAIMAQGGAGGWNGTTTSSGLSHTPAAGVGEEGVFEFQVKSTAQSHQALFALMTVVSDTFSTWIENEGLSNPDLHRAITVHAKTQNEIQGLNLGSPVTLTYDPSQSVEMPQIHDASGAIWPWMKCSHWLSSNTGVLLEQPISPRQAPNDWRTTGVGETTVSCCDSDAIGVQSVQVTVQGADPQLQGFPAIEIGMDSSPLTLIAPASLNASGAWSYSIVNSDENPVAEIVDGQVVPRAAGTVTIRATQAAADNYRETSIEAELTVDPASARSFADIVATYGDPDFTVPRPGGAPTTGVEISYTIEDSTVAEVVNGKIHDQRRERERHHDHRTLARRWRSIRNGQASSLCTRPSPGWCSASPRGSMGSRPAAPSGSGQWPTRA